MDTKLLFTGGEPNMNENDFMRTQNSLYDALVQLGKHQNAGNDCVMAGCTLTVGATASISTGLVYMSNRPVLVDAQSSVAIGDYYYLTILTEYESGGNKIYDNGISRQTWKKERAILQSGASVPSGSLDLNNVAKSITIPQLIEILSDIYQAENDIDALQTIVGGISSGLVKDVDDLQSVANTSTEKAYLDFITDVEGMSPQEIECTEANPEQDILTVADSLSLQTTNVVDATIVVPQKRCGTVIISYVTDTQNLNFKLAGGAIFYTHVSPTEGEVLYWNTLGFPFVIKAN